MGIVVCKKSNTLRCSPNELERKKIPYVVTYFENKKIIIALKTKMIPNEIVIREKENIPLYKQAINFQMGRIKTNSIKQCRFKIHEPKFSKNEYFELYEEI